MSARKAGRNEEPRTENREPRTARQSCLPVLGSRFSVLGSSFLPPQAPGMTRDTFLALIRGQRRGLGAAFARLALRAASVPYGWGVALRNLAFDRGWKRRFDAGVPVISVGNLTLGGTGKTPCVEYLAQWCRQHDIRVAILSRGYGAEAGRNDEALVLEENCPDVPHLQGADRAALAEI